jgi:hypothetical protein
MKASDIQQGDSIELPDQSRVTVQHIAAAYNEQGHVIIVNDTYNMGLEADVKLLARKAR